MSVRAKPPPPLGDPPARPVVDDPEALIAAARRHQRARRRRIALAVVAVGVLGLAAYLAVAVGGHGRSGLGASHPTVATRRGCPGVDLGSVAFVRNGALATVDLRDCRTRVLIPRGVAGPVGFSDDGRYIAFAGRYVATTGGPPNRVGGTGVWSPQADLLVMLSDGGAALVTPQGGSRQLVPRGWGATTAAFSPDGRTLALSRSRYALGTSRSRWHLEIWLVDLASGRRRMIFHEPAGMLAPPLLAGFSPDGRWLTFWEDTQNSASLEADGTPLMVVAASGGRPIRITTGELHYRDFLTWCGDTLVYVTNRGGRFVIAADGIAAAAPPAWRSQTLLPTGGHTSWNSVACPATTAPAGTDLAIAAGPSGSAGTAGASTTPDRSIWLASAADSSTPRRLAATVPATHRSDELPMWSADGGWIVYVQARTTGATDHGLLYAYQPSRRVLAGPITVLGTTNDYYGAFGWTNQLDWHR